MMPPEKQTRPKRGVVPFHSANTPSLRRIDVKQSKVLLYRDASSPCILVFTTSNGMVAYTLHGDGDGEGDGVGDGKVKVKKTEMVMVNT